jgi:hypothetical protein
MGPFGAFKEHGTRLKAIDPVAELARCLLTGAMGREAGSWQVANIADTCRRSVLWLPRSEEASDDGVIAA